MRLTTSKTFQGHLIQLTYAHNWEFMFEDDPCGTIVPCYVGLLLMSPPQLTVSLPELMEVVSEVVSKIPGPVALGDFNIHAEAQARAHLKAVTATKNGFEMALVTLALRNRQGSMTAYFPGTFIGFQYHQSQYPSGLPLRVGTRRHVKPIAVICCKDLATLVTCRIDHCNGLYVGLTFRSDHCNGLYVGLPLKTGLKLVSTECCC